MLEQFAREAAHVLAGGVERLDGAEDRGGVAREDRAREVFEGLSRDEAEDAEGIVLGDPLAREGDELVEGTERVAHAALGAARDGEQGVLVRLDALLAADVAEARGDLVRLDAAQVEALAARDDRGEHLVALGRREDELHVGRRLLQRLEEGVPRRAREHVAFVDDEDLVLRGDGLELHGVHDRLHVLDLVVRGRVELGHVDGAAGGDLAAVLARAARLHAVRVRAVEGLGEDARGRRLADAARADEEIGVRDAPARDGVAQRAHDVFLPHDVVERHRAVLERQRDVRGLLLFFHAASIAYRRAPWLGRSIWSVRETAPLRRRRRDPGKRRPHTHRATSPGRSR